MERVGLPRAKELWGLSDAGVEYIRSAIADATMPGVEPRDGRLSVRRTDDVIVAWNRGEIAHDDQRRPCARFAQEAQHARLGVVIVDPFKACAIEIDFIQRGRRAIKRIEIGYPALDAGVLGLIEHPPFQRIIMRPFASLAELPAHEQQLLPRVRPHVAVEQAQIRELAP